MGDCAAPDKVYMSRKDYVTSLYIVAIITLEGAQWL